jgi:hypothetical protein
MAGRRREGALSKDEKKIVKALLGKGWRNQDIQALLNIGRAATVNSARITEVKKDANQRAASDDEVAFFQIKKRSVDPKTGLNLFDDERLIRAREAMILAVQIFNSAALSFKTEVCAMLVNVAWTYLLHEFYARKGVQIVEDDGRSLLLSQMVEREDCPLADGVRNNLRALKIIRDDVEHKLLGRSDTKWQGLFQACCLNFDKALCEIFGSKLTLANELAFALQFTRMDVEQLSTLNKYEIPAHIEAIDARLAEGMTDEFSNISFASSIHWMLHRKAGLILSSYAPSRSRERTSGTSSLNTRLLTICFLTNLPVFASSCDNARANRSRSTTTPRPGSYSKCAQPSKQNNRRTRTKITASIIPRTATIPIRTNGLTDWLKRSLTISDSLPSKQSRSDNTNASLNGFLRSRSFITPVKSQYALAASAQRPCCRLPWRRDQRRAAA